MKQREIARVPPAVLAVIRSGTVHVPRCSNPHTDLGNYYHFQEREMYSSVESLRAEQGVTARGRISRARSDTVADQAARSVHFNPELRVIDRRHTDVETSESSTQRPRDSLALEHGSHFRTYSTAPANSSYRSMGGKKSKLNLRRIWKSSRPKNDIASADSREHDTKLQYAKAPLNRTDSARISISKLQALDRCDACAEEDIQSPCDHRDGAVSPLSPQTPLFVDEVDILNWRISAASHDQALDLTRLEYLGTREDREAYSDFVDKPSVSKRLRKAVHRAQTWIC